MACGFLLGTRACSTDGAVRLAFPADGTFELVGAELQMRGQEVVATVTSGGAAVRAQLARIIGLDQDGDAFAAVLGADPVLAEIASRRPGFRPVVAYSPYVMAGWCVLSQRLAMAQAVKIQQRMAESCGDVVEVHGQRLASFPRPQSLLSLTEVPGLSPEKLSRLHAVARAAQEGLLEVERLQAMPYDEAKFRLMEVRGIGTWTADGILVRGCGLTDALPLAEPRLHAIVGQRYGLGRAATDAEVSEIAEAWRPFRTWASVLLVSESFGERTARPAFRRGSRAA